jgi:trimethylamine--corrinoid protein Co-methyltransferase
MEKSLLLAEKGIPNVVYGMPMAGATAPASFAGCLCIANAEVLSHIAVLQIKHPGAPVIFGSIPNIMDMKTSINPYGAPELSLMVGAYTELCHYYEIPMFGTAGCTDAAIIGSQAAAEVTYSIFTSILTGADLVHDVGLMDHATMLSPELAVLTDEIIDMVNVLTRGIQINDETLALDLIEKVGPRSDYLQESHTLKHFRNFWFPSVFDRSMTRDSETRDCEQLLNEKTLSILRTHQPKSMPDDLIKELKKMEERWFKRIGIAYAYPS